MCINGRLFAADVNATPWDLYQPRESRFAWWAQPADVEQDSVEKKKEKENVMNESKEEEEDK